jgi:DHA1 family multidrug resistance protein-like MFS transporter
MNKKAFFALSTVIFTTQLGMNIISPLMAVYARTLGANALWLGIMVSGMAFSYIIFAPISGWLADRVSRKRLMIIGLAAYTLFSIGYASTNVYMLTGIRLLHGAASALVGPVAQAYVGNLSPKGKEGTFINIFMMFMYLGMAVGPIMGGALYDQLGMNYAFYAMGTLSALSLLFLIVFVPPFKPVTGQARAGLMAIFTPLRDNRIKAANLHLGSRAILRQGITSFLPLYAITILGMTATNIGFVLTIFVFTEAISQGLMGSFADRANKKALLLGGTSIAAILAFFLGSMTTQWTLLLILVPIAFSTSLARASASVYHVQVGRQMNNMGASMGILNATQGLGSAIGPILYGIVIDTFGLPSIFLTGGITGIMVLPFMAYYLFKKQPEISPLVAPAGTAAVAEIKATK